MSFFNGNNGREELTAFGFDVGSSLAIKNNLVKYSSLFYLIFRE